MKIISIDTSRKFCNLSIQLGNDIEELNSTVPLSHSKDLPVNVKKLIDKYQISIKDLDFIAINIGPGSFTGLRIGVSFAKGLSFSNNIPLIPVNSFEIIENKINMTNKTFYLCVYSHKSYAYGQKYKYKNKFGIPKLIDLTKNIKDPIYIANLDSNKYSSNKINHINFNSLDLLEVAKKNLDKKVTNDLNSFNPLYINNFNVS